MGDCVRHEVVLIVKKLRLAEIMSGHIIVNYKIVWITVIWGHPVFKSLLMSDSTSMCRLNAHIEFKSNERIKTCQLALAIKYYSHEHFTYPPNVILFSFKNTQN